MFPHGMPPNLNCKGEMANQTLVLTFDSKTILTEGNGSLTMNIRFAKADWSSYGTLTNQKVNVYYDGELVQ